MRLIPNSLGCQGWTHTASCDPPFLVHLVGLLLAGWPQLGLSPFRYWGLCQQETPYLRVVGPRIVPEAALPGEILCIC
jgi:hypothetical protein